MAVVRTAWRRIAAGIALSLSVAGGAFAQESPAKQAPAASATATAAAPSATAITSDETTAQSSA